MSRQTALVLLLAAMTLGLLGALFVDGLRDEEQKTSGSAAPPQPPPPVATVAPPGQAPRDRAAPASRATYPPFYPDDGDGSRKSRTLPPREAPAAEWARAIDFHRRNGNAIALFAAIETGPGADGRERADIQRQAIGALATLGDVGRPYFEDLLQSQDRTIRLCAVNVAIRAWPENEPEIIARLEEDPDPVFQAKAKALRERRR